MFATAPKDPSHKNNGCLIIIVLAILFLMWKACN